MTAQEPLRWILHLDMDAFFASVEQMDNPELRGRPVIIGGAERGVVSTASYEARVVGVRSAMPMFQARKLCPGGVFLPGRMRRYREKSREVMQVVKRFSPLVEQASVDEAYLDASGCERLFGSAQELARSLQSAVFRECGLSGSVGLAPLKFLAKIASDMKKPGGLTVLAHEEMADFLRALPVGKIPGVGKRMREALDLLGVRFAGEVARYPEEFWLRRLGKPGKMLFDRARGVDPRAVEPFTDPKSESAENTFSKDIHDKEELAVWLLRQSERVGRSLRKQGLAGRSITLKLKYDSFDQHTKSMSLKQPTNLTRTIYESALAMLMAYPLERPLRLIGVGVSQFAKQERQLSLFPDPEEERAGREAALDTALDALRERFGARAVLRGKLFRGEEGPQGGRI